MTTSTSSHTVSAFVYVLFVAVLISGGSVGRVEAHTLKVDGDVGAVLHTDPNDEPSAGAPATLIFDFKDTQMPFGDADYILSLSINSSDGTIATSSALTFADGSSTAQFPFTFATPGVYTAKVTGTSEKLAPFTLTYQIRVVPGVTQSGSTIGRFFGVHGGHVLLTGILILILVSVIGWEKLKEHRAIKSASASTIN